MWSKSLWTGTMMFLIAMVGTPPEELRSVLLISALYCAMFVIWVGTGVSLWRDIVARRLHTRCDLYPIDMLLGWLVGYRFVEWVVFVLMFLASALIHQHQGTPALPELELTWFGFLVATATVLVVQLLIIACVLSVSGSLEKQQPASIAIARLLFLLWFFGCTAAYLELNGVFDWGNEADTQASSLQFYVWGALLAWIRFLFTDWPRRLSAFIFRYAIAFVAVVLFIAVPENTEQYRVLSYALEALGWIIALQIIEEHAVWRARGTAWRDRFHQLGVDMAASAGLLSAVAMRQMEAGVSYGVLFMVVMGEMWRWALWGYLLRLLVRRRTEHSLSVFFIALFVTFFLSASRIDNIGSAGASTTLDALAYLGFHALNLDATVLRDDPWRLVVPLFDIALWSTLLGIVVWLVDRPLWGRIFQRSFLLSAELRRVWGLWYPFVRGSMSQRYVSLVVIVMIVGLPVYVMGDMVMQSVGMEELRWHSNSSPFHISRAQGITVGLGAILAWALVYRDMQSGMLTRLVDSGLTSRQLGARYLFAPMALPSAILALMSLTSLLRPEWLVGVAASGVSVSYVMLVLYCVIVLATTRRPMPMQRYRGITYSLILLVVFFTLSVGSGGIVFGHGFGIQDVQSIGISSLAEASQMDWADVASPEDMVSEASIRMSFSGLLALVFLSALTWSITTARFQVLRGWPIPRWFLWGALLAGILPGALILLPAQGYEPCASIAVTFMSLLALASAILWTTESPQRALLAVSSRSGLVLLACCLLVKVVYAAPMWGVLVGSLTLSARLFGSLGVLVLVARRAPRLSMFCTTLLLLLSELVGVLWAEASLPVSFPRDIPLSTDALVMLGAERGSLGLWPSSFAQIGQFGALWSADLPWSELRWHLLSDVVAPSVGFLGLGAAAMASRRWWPGIAGAGMVAALALFSVRPDLIADVDARLAAGDSAGAAALAQERLADRPASAPLRYRLGLALEQSDGLDLILAYASYTEALTLTSSYPEASEGLARLERSGAYNAARRRRLLELLAEAPADLSLLSELLELSLAAGDSGAAEAALERALAVSDDALLHLERARLLAQKGDAEAAEDAVRAAEAQASGEVLNEVIAAYADLGADSSLSLLCGTHPERVAEALRLPCGQGYAVLSRYRVAARFFLAIPDDSADAERARQEFGALPKGALGVRLAPVSPLAQEALSAPTRSGVLLSGMLPRSVASDAGVQPGDVLLEVDAAPVETVEQVKSLVTQRYAGETVTLTVLRRGERIHITIPLGNWSPQPVLHLSMGPEALTGAWLLARDASLGSCGLEEADLIERVRGTPVSSRGATVAAGEALTMTVSRDDGRHLLVCRAGTTIRP